MRRPGRPVSRVLYPPGRTVAIYLGPTLPADSSSQPGDGPGTHSPPIRPCSRWGLAASVSPRMAGRSYRPISPLPRSLLRATWAVCFCATFRPPADYPSTVLRTANEGPGSYPAPCPVEPGLSSPPPLAGQGSDHPAYLAGPLTNVPHPVCGVNLSRRGAAVALANVEDTSAAVAPHRLPAHAGTLQLVSGEGHSAAPAQASLHPGDGLASPRHPQALV